MLRHLRLCSLLSILLLAGCSTGGGSGSPEPAAIGDGPPAREAGAPAASGRGLIGVSVLTFQNPFFRVIGDHVVEEAKVHGFDAVVVSGDFDPAKQAHQVRDFIVRKAAAIVLSPCDSNTIGPVIQEANNAGIPVFLVDIPCNDPSVKIVSQIASDNYGGGKLAGEAMIEALGEAGGKVAILHFKQAESCQLRVKGFREVIDAHNADSPSKIEIVAELEGGGQRESGYRAAEDALQAHPDLAGVFAINDPSALGARAALEKAGKAEQIKIVGFDGQPEGKEAIRDGKIYADPIQFPDKMGIEVVRAIVKHYEGEELPPQMLIPTSLYRQADGQADAALK